MLGARHEIECATKGASKQSPRGAPSSLLVVIAAEFATNGYHGPEEAKAELSFAKPLPLDGRGDVESAMRTISSDSIHSIPSSRKGPITLVDEVGIHVHEYLENRFSNDVPSLDGEKFHHVPEIDPADITKKGHLGSGGFSDVFEVICESRQLSHDSTDIKAVGVGGLRHSFRRRFPRHGLSLSFSGSASGGATTLPRPATSQHCENNKHHSSSSCRGSTVFAMKCLRPHIRSDVDQFTLGAEDQIRETAILANLDHAHIIKMHGRSSGHLTEAFSSKNFAHGYFILLDRLSETLGDRINVWKRKQDILAGPTATQFEVAYSIADAMAYLHYKEIVFRDLKPHNVGFDRTGVLKVFDFGSAVGLPKFNERNPTTRGRLLRQKCGTPRYMAPEVGLSRGYGVEADVYSFGILLWEMCAWTKPFSCVGSSEGEFERAVYRGGKRPMIKDRWPETIKELIGDCWSACPSERPTMMDVKSSLSLAKANTPSREGSQTKMFRFRRNRACSM